MCGSLMVPIWPPVKVLQSIYIHNNPSQPPESVTKIIDCHHQNHKTFNFCLILPLLLHYSHRRFLLNIFEKTGLSGPCWEIALHSGILLFVATNKTNSLLSTARTGRTSTPSSDHSVDRVKDELRCATEPQLAQRPTQTSYSISTVSNRRLAYT